MFDFSVPFIVVATTSHILGILFKQMVLDLRVLDFQLIDYRAHVYNVRDRPNHPSIDKEHR